MKRFLFLIVLSAVLAVSSNCFADVTWGNAVNWNGDGNWMDASKWIDSAAAPDWYIPGMVVGNPKNTVPSTDPDWNDGYAIFNSGTANLTPISNPDGTVRILYVGTSSANATLNISDDLTVRRQTYMGYLSTAGAVHTINQTAGNVVCGTNSGLDQRRFYGGRGTGTSVYNLSAGTMTTAADYDNFGYDGSCNFVFNQTGGTFTDTGLNLHLGYSAGTNGTVNLSNGTFTAASDNIYVGVYGYGFFNQTGGDVTAERIKIGVNSGSSGLYSISGGTLQINRYLAGTYGATFEVVGSGATSIRAAQFSVYEDTLKVALDAGGSTLIEVYGLSTETYSGANLEGCVFEVNTIAGFNGQIGDVYDVLWSATDIDVDALTFNNLSDELFNWRVVDKNNGKMLQLVVVDEAAVVEGPFKIAVLPDSQYYSQDYPATFAAQTQWIVDNLDTEDIAFVTHLGDVVDDGDNIAQWNNADAAMDTLDGNVPYSVCIGNHDYHDRPDRSAGAAEFISYFGSARYGYSWYGGAHSRGLSHYQTLYVEGREWLHLNLEFQADDEILLWAQRILDAHPNSPTILSTHSYLSDTGLWANSASDFGSMVTNGGENQFYKLVTHNDQIFMVLNGHHASYGGLAQKVSQNIFGHDVFQMCVNYQGYDDGGGGFLRTYEFDFDNDVINAKSYSPTRDEYKTDPNNQFTLSVDFDDRFDFSHRQVLNTVQAGNISVIENNTNNEIDSVTVYIPAGQSTADFNVIDPCTNTYTNHSNGDYFVQAGDSCEDDALNGIMLTSVAETGRANLGITYPAAYHVASAHSGGHGAYWIATAETSQTLGTITIPGGSERDVNVAAAYFPFSGGWTCGQVKPLETNQLSWSIAGSEDVVLGDNLVQLAQNTVADPNVDCNKPNGNSWNLTDIDRGVWNLYLTGVDSIEDGVLLVCGGSNEDNYACASPWPNGSGWQISVQDGGSNGGATESDPFNFVYVPYSTEGIVAGRISGRAGILNGTGGFSIERIYFGGHRLYIDGYTPEDGVLLVTSELEWYNDDDFNTYRAEGDHWVIENRDLTGAIFANSTEAQYVFVFIPFDNAPAGPGPARDFDYTEVLAANFDAVWSEPNDYVNVQKVQGSFGYDAAWHNKGVYYQSVNGDRMEAMNAGITLGTIREFSRNDDDGNGSYVPTMSSREYNWVGFNYPYTGYGERHGNGSFASVWIPRGSGYSWGDVTSAGDRYVNSSYGACYEGSDVTITSSYMGSVGRYKYVFNDFTPADGVLVTIGRTAANAMTSVMPLADGWEVTCRVNQSNASTYHEHWSRYAFFPYATGGKTTVAEIAADGTVTKSSGQVTATKTATGTYTVDVLGGSPDRGVLLLTCYDGETATGAAPAFLAYEANGDSFTVKCFNLDSPRAETDQDFALVYVPFDRTAFFDSSSVNFEDFASFALSWSMGQADEDYNAKWDIDGSGTVDVLDLKAFASCWLAE